ncbi:hypothetical protein Tco_0938667 [Tanacetum coccineum]|uniref:Uncharacterized protein n=1 Tax=Tanacetum coccineum TaxID=301880 RepID=A0ABQ5DIG1_9ASTR
MVVPLSAKALIIQEASKWNQREITLKFGPLSLKYTLALAVKLLLASGMGTDIREACVPFWSSRWNQTVPINIPLDQVNRGVKATNKIREVLMDNYAKEKRPSDGTANSNTRIAFSK